MFLKTSEFKKQVKKAYEGMGIHVMHFEDGLFAINAGWWFLEVKKDYFTKANMAALISIVGALPDKGHAVLYQKTREPQEEILEVNYQDLSDEYKRTKTNYKTTNVVFRTQNTSVEVMQQLNGLEHVLIPQQFIGMIDTGKIEAEEDMNSSYGASADELNKMFWASDQMILACRKRPCRYLGEKTFIEAISRIDLEWKWTEEEVIYN